MLHKQPLLCKKFMMNGRSFSLQTLLNAHYGPITNPYNSAAWLVSVLIGTHPKDLEKAFSGPDERLTSGMQTFASRVANICNRGCNALRLSWEWLENGLYISDYQALRRRKIRAKRWRCLFLMIGSQESGIHKAHFCLLRVGQMPLLPVSAESEAFRRCWENAKRKQKGPPV